MGREAWEVVDLAGLAEAAGLSYNTARIYRGRGLMPEPDGYVGASPWWWSETVEAWVAQREIASARRHT